MSYPIVCCCSSVPEAGWFRNHTDVILRLVNGTEFRCTQGMVRILQGCLEGHLQRSFYRGDEMTLPEHAEPS